MYCGAQGGVPDDGFFRNAEGAILFYDITKNPRYVACNGDNLRRGRHARGAATVLTHCAASPPPPFKGTLPPSGTDKTTQL